MADLLGSILSTMAKPPSIDDKRKKLIKQQQEQLAKQKEQDKQRLAVFRKEIEDKVNKFIQDPQMKKIKFDPMSKVKRSIIHDIAEVAGLTSFSFGEEDIDRHIMLFKKEFAPCDDELQAYRKGETWDAEKGKELIRQRELAKKLQEEEDRLKPATEVAPNSNYKEKYEKLLGKDAGIDAAKVAKVNQQFGNVPSANKRDQRSIEQTLADIRAKKKLKCGPSEEDNAIP